MGIRPRPGARPDHRVRALVTALEVERLSLGELVQRSFLEAGKAAYAAGLTLELESSEVGPDLDIDGDPERLAQVFDNLFSNAIKYTAREGKVTVASDLRGRPCRGPGARHGTGHLPRTSSSEIFTKFFRSSTVLTDAIPGIGLGLAITKRHRRRARRRDRGLQRAR